MKKNGKDKLLPRTGRKPLALRRQVLLFGLMGLALLVVTAFIYDLNVLQKRREKPRVSVSDELTDILVMQELKPYTDPEGRFRFEVPRNWTRDPEDAKHKGYDVVFSSPNGFRFSVMTEPMKSKSFVSLKKDIQQIQANSGLNMNLHETTFAGMPAMERKVVLHYSTLVTLDFLKDGVAHEIQVEYPHRYEKEAAQALPQLFETYQPLNPTGPQ